MSSTNHRLSEFVARHRRRVEVAELIQQITDDDPAFIEELVDLLHEKSASSSMSDRGPTAADRVAEVFESNGNEWLTTQDLVEQTGLDRSQIGTALHKSGRGRFENKAHPDHGRKRLYRLAVHENHPNTPVTENGDGH